CCECRGCSTVYNTDFATWKMRDKKHLRCCAEAWQDAETLAEREQIYKEDGTRWSKMWRLPYWDPARMLSPDPMHIKLEGMAHYHCRYILKLNLLDAKKFEKSAPAYQHNFPSLDTETPAGWDMMKETHQKSVEGIYKLLVYQFSENEDSNELTPEILEERLERQYKIPLAWVCYQLKLPEVIPLLVPQRARKKTKKPTKTSKKQKESVPEKPLKREEYLLRVNKLDLAKLLVAWVVPEKAINETSFRFMQQVIANTTTPAWVNHVPKNYREKKAGSMKADEWRLLITIYLPIALVLLWGED
ncbi:hypothetical protein C8R45DRAFT_779282, partial [Mycena sanguinolenta]